MKTICLAGIFSKPQYRASLFPGLFRVCQSSSKRSCCSDTPRRRNVPEIRFSLRQASVQNRYPFQDAGSTASRRIVAFRFGHGRDNLNPDRSVSNGIPFISTDEGYRKNIEPGWLQKILQSCPRCFGVASSRTKARFFVPPSFSTTTRA